MQKIISLFQRNYEGDRLVRDELVPGAEWVAAGEGVATRKFDGTAAMVRSGVLYKRHDQKPGRTAPAGWEAAQEPDLVTGHHPGWLPVGDGPEDAAFRMAGGIPEADGTYELIGPKVQGNPENVPAHLLVRHGKEVLPDAPRDFAGIRDYLANHDIEGIVWHHPDGRMVKIKVKDFGLKRECKPANPFQVTSLEGEMRQPVWRELRPLLRIWFWPWLVYLEPKS